MIPASLFFTGARSVKDSDVVTALAKLLSSDEGICFSHG
jgi:hypothetical protein